MKKCNTCNKELIKAFFNAQSGDDCVFCANERIELEKVEKKDFEEVESVGCDGGGCTL